MFDSFSKVLTSGSAGKFGLTADDIRFMRDTLRSAKLMVEERVKKDGDNSEREALAGKVLDQVKAGKAVARAGDMGYLITAADIRSTLKDPLLKIEFYRQVVRVRDSKEIPEWIERRVQKALEDDDFNSPAWHVFVDPVGRIIGRMAVENGNLGDMGVLLEYQGKKIGEFMFKYFLNVCVRNRVAAVIPAEKQSTRWYWKQLEDMGFSETEVRRWTISQGNHHLDWDVITIPANRLKGAAMDLQLEDLDNGEFKKGGIDLNSRNLNLQIKRDGAGVPLPIGLQQVENIRLDGLTPEILSIDPVTSLPVLSDVLAGVGGISP
jgi:hypothetical protein